MYNSHVCNLCSIIHPIQALRCRTDDGLSEEDMKRIARTCMKQVGNRDGDFNDNDSSNNSENSDNDSDEDNNDRNGRNRHQGHQNQYNQYNGKNSRQKYDYKRFSGLRDEKRYNRQQDWGNDNNYNNNNNNNNYNNNNNNNQRNQSNQNRGRYDSNYSTNNTDQDRNCLMHCFFREMKMVRFGFISKIMRNFNLFLMQTNNDDYPDKHKVLNVLAKDIRERDLREFYYDSIQQCFHMIDVMDNHHRKKDKCLFTQSIVTCLTERARANCEDFMDDGMMF